MKKEFLAVVVAMLVVSTIIAITALILKRDKQQKAFVIIADIDPSL